MKPMIDKSFFNKNREFTAEAIKCEIESRKVLQSIYSKWIDKGYSSQEISHILNLSSQVIECEKKFGNSLSQRPKR